MENKDELTIQQLEEAINEMHKSKVVDVAYRINYDLVCKVLVLLKKQKEENEILEEALELMRSHACFVVSNRRRCHLCDGCYLREEQKERFKEQAKARIDERNRQNEKK